MNLETYELIIYVLGASTASVVVIAWILGVLLLNAHIIQQIINRTKMLQYLAEYIMYRKYFKAWFEKNEGKRVDQI